jgi:branched-chain amino acid transport system ATP-binding protein
MSEICLEAAGLGGGYGAVQVLWDVNLRIARGEVVALVGSNGAGKTTLLRTLSGLLEARTGRITFNGRDITRVPAEQRTKLGLAHVPEGRRLFAGMTVQENILVGGFTQSSAQAQRDLERMWELFPELRGRRKQLAGTLSGGEQQMCAIARGLMINPSLLMMDELSLGLAPIVVTRLVDLLARICKETNIAVLLVEQDVQLAFEMASRGYVFETGRVALEGRSEDLLVNPEVKRAYIGV